MPKEAEKMADYRKMYLQLFDAAERALTVLNSDSAPAEKVALAKALLTAGQQRCEDLYVETAEQ